MIDMEGFLEYANLPRGNVTCVVVSDIIPELLTELVNNYSIKVVVPSPLNKISGSEKYHADMSFFHLGMNRFILDKNNNDLKKHMEKIGGIITDCDQISASVPKLNACLLKDVMICNKTITDENIRNYCNEKKIKLLHTKQRYAKCSTAIVTDNAVITTDESIYRICKEEGIDVLKVRNEGIDLYGYNYGFIGGCCGLISNNLLAFSGAIQNHPDYNNIKAFAGNYGISIISLGSNKLYDIGGIIPVTERK